MCDEHITLLCKVSIQFCGNIKHSSDSLPQLLKPHHTARVVCLALGAARNILIQNILKFVWQFLLGFH
jgi:hypothetical protein